VCFATGGLAISRAIAIMATDMRIFPVCLAFPMFRVAWPCCLCPLTSDRPWGLDSGNGAGSRMGEKNCPRRLGYAHRIASHHIVSYPRLAITSHAQNGQHVSQSLFCSILLNFFLCFFSADRIGRSAGAIEMPDRGESWCVIAFPQGEKERIEISYFVPLRFGPIYLDVL
jgi:hypothetical protein